MLRNNRGQAFMLIEILVVAVIIGVAGFYMARHYTTVGLGHAKPGEPPTVKDRAVGTDCANNLRQFRFAIQLLQTGADDVALPPTLHELADKQGMSRSMEKCPISGKEYGYDAARGLVWCTTPGHEKF